MDISNPPLKMNKLTQASVPKQISRYSNLPRQDVAKHLRPHMTGAPALNSRSSHSHTQHTQTHTQRHPT